MGNRPVSEARGLTAAAATGVQVGLAMVATRALAGELGPVTLALMRYAVGLAVLAPFALRIRWAAMARADILPVLGLGIAQFGLLVAALNWGLARVPASRGALIFATFPLLTMVLAAALGREAMSARKALGTLISIAGVALTLGAGLMQGGGSFAGGLAVLAAAGVGAICAVLYRPYLMRYPTLQVGSSAMAAAVVALALFAGPEAPLAALAALGARGWGLVLFIGLSSGAGYVLWLTALRHTSPTRATVLLGLSPVTAAILGVLLLGEAPGPTLWAGLGAVLAGAALAVSGRAEGAKVGLAIGRAGR